MTYEEVVELALSRTMELSDTVPSTRRPLYRRINLREQELARLAGRENPEYTGRSGILVLTADSAPLSALDTEEYWCEEPVRVTIADPGDSAWAEDTTVSIVTTIDPEAGLPPRAVLRSGSLEGFQGELEGVTSLWVYFTTIPTPSPTDESGSRLVTLRSGPAEELLVIDLTRYLLQKALRLEPETQAQQLNLLKAEEEEYLASFLAHVREYGALATARRHGRKEA